MGIALAATWPPLPGYVRRPRTASTYSYTLRSLAASWPSAAHVQGMGCAAERSSCAGQPPDRGIQACACTSCLHRDSNATSYGATCRYTCRRERCATRAPPIQLCTLFPPLEHIRRNHTDIARLYTFSRLQQVIEIYRKPLIVLYYALPIRELQRGPDEPSRPALACTCI